MTGSDLITLLKKNPIGVVCGILAILCGATLYFRSGVHDEAKVTLDAITKQSQEMLSNVRNSAGLIQQVDAMQQAIKQLDGRLVKSGQLATNLQYFYRLESDTGVKLTDVRQNQIGRSSGSTYIGIPYVVSIQGTFKQVMEFLLRLESGRHFSKFSSVSFNKTAGAETTSNLISVNINVELLGTP